MSRTRTDGTETRSDWLVQVWEHGAWQEYWPVTIIGTSRRAARARAPRVFCGTYRTRHAARALRWRVGPMLRVFMAPVFA